MKYDGDYQKKKKKKKYDGAIYASWTGWMMIELGIHVHMHMPCIPHHVHSSCNPSTQPTWAMALPHSSTDNDRMGPSYVYLFPLSTNKNGKYFITMSFSFIC